MTHYVFAGSLSDSCGLRTNDGINVVIPSIGLEPNQDRFAENLVKLIAQGRAWRDGRTVEFWEQSAYGKGEGSVPLLTSISAALDLAVQVGWRGAKLERGSVVYDPLTHTLETSCGPRLLGFFSEEMFPTLQGTFCESERRLRIDFNPAGNRAGFRLEGLNTPELGYFVKENNFWVRKWPGLEKP